MTNVPPPSAAPQPAAPGPAKQDYTMGWLAHLLMLFTCFIGPLIIWLVKKDQDKYAAFHAKQATFWAVALTAVCIVLGILLRILTLITMGLASVGYCLFGLVGLGNLAYVIYAIVATSQGKPFKYILVADMFCKKEFAEAYPNVAPKA